MLEEEKNKALGPSVPDEMWEDLKHRAAALMDKLEDRDYNSVSEVIHQLNEVRDRSIYHEVGRLTRGLHDAIVNFDISPARAGLDSEDSGQESQMANAKDRLDYVISLTQKSADKTMDMVEEGIPITAEIGDSARVLRDDWGRLLRREMDPDEFRDLAKRIDNHLNISVHGNEQLSQKLNEILLAQDFQDLTGQVIKKVITLVQEVEDRLVELMRVAGKVEQLTGIVTAATAEKVKTADNILDSAAEGPQIHAETREDVVSGQDDVDDLLSSLGF
jgi:chemotaxis protein CheZ